jgi:tRNA(Ile)-lysidine synthase
LRRADAGKAAATAGIDTLFRIDTDLLKSFSTLDLTGRHAIVAAVSGGSDSVALLLLAKAWLETSFPAVRLVAVTVDHRLRQESAAEARDVAALCARHGIAHRIMHWEGDKPASGVSAAAREARYRLLAEAARSAGADIVLTGHTLDDQAETVAMRRARGEGRGLAGMAPATLFEGRTWLVRPLLGARRHALRDFLRAHETGWVDDPSNTNTSYERPRVRAGLAAEGEQRELLAVMDLAQRNRVALGARAATLLRETAALAAPGLIRLQPHFAAAVDVDAGIYALRILLAVCGGAAYLPDEDRSGELFRRLGSGPLRATLSRTVVDARKDGIFLRRESRGLPAAAPIVDGMVWDGRYRLFCPEVPVGLTIAPLGAAYARKAALPHPDSPQSLVGAALALQPALWSGEECLGPATGDGARARGIKAVPVAAPWAHFLPSFDIAIVQALAELLGCEAVPSLPFVGHNEG